MDASAIKGGGGGHGRRGRERGTSGTVGRSAFRSRRSLELITSELLLQQAIQAGEDKPTLFAVVPPPEEAAAAEAEPTPLFAVVPPPEEAAAAEAEPTPLFAVVPPPEEVAAAEAEPTPWFDNSGETQAGPSQLAGTSLVYSPEYHKALKKKAAQEKKREAKLSPVQRSKLYAARRRREIGKFACPNTPPKSRRTLSPERVVPCPLVPGTPAVPPPRIPQKWELKKLKLDDTGLSKVGELPAAEDLKLPPREVMPPPPQEIQPLIFTPSTGVILVGEGHEVDENLMVSADIEFVSLSPSESSSAVRSGATLQHSSPGSSPSSAKRKLKFKSGLDDERLQLERSADRLNPGSDAEEDEDCPDPHTPHRRHAGEFCMENLPRALHKVLGSMDRQDDLALRQSSQENMLDFTWSHDPDVFTGVRESFTGPAGPTFPTVGLSPFQIFSKIWDEDIINLTVAETNKYAAHLLTHCSPSANSRMRRWVPITAQDLWTFIGIIMLQSIVPLPVEEDYWSPCLPYLKMGKFPDIMPFHRFRLIKRCLHFVDNTLCASETPSKLVKIQPVIDHLNSKFSSLYLPGQEIAIDESLLLWKGRLSFAQLIATKAAQVGIKSYELCESKTGYLWQMIIYTGKKAHNEKHNVEAIDTDEAEPEESVSMTVMQLVRPLLNRGHTLVMDNFYNSPLLTRVLKAQKTDVMGTLRLNREFVPHSLRTKNKLAMRSGEVEFSQTRDMTIVMWRDSNVVSLISTYHKVEIGGKEKYGYYRYKPKVVLDYNMAMGGVDKKDQLLQAFPVERVRNQVWYKKLFRRLLNVSIHNAFVMATSTANTATMPQRQFRVRLADEIMQRFRRPKPQPPLTVADHFPVKVAKKLDCKWCYKHNKRSRTVFKCELCDVALCIIGCYRDHHRSLRD